MNALAHTKPHPKTDPLWKRLKTLASNMRTHSVRFHAGQVKTMADDVRKLENGVYPRRVRRLEKLLRDLQADTRDFLQAKHTKAELLSFLEQLAERCEA